MATIFNRRSSAPAAKSGVRIPAWAFARRISERSMKKELREMDQSPFSVAKKTVQSFDSVEENDSLLLPQMKARTAATTPVPPQAKTPVAPTPAPTTTDRAPSLLLQMDVTGFRVGDLHVEVDTQKRMICLSGMGPRMFKRAIPLPPSIQTNGDMACLEASIVVLDNDKSGGRHYLLVQSNPSRVHTSTKDDDDGDDHSSLSSSNLGKVAPTTSKKENTDSVSSRAGRRSIKIRNDTRPPLQIAVPHSVAGLCA